MKKRLLMTTMCFIPTGIGKLAVQLKQKRKILFMVVLLSCRSFAQEKKEAIPQRDVALPSQEAVQEKTETPLPKIDLPEFVITGQEQISAPTVKKESFDEEKIYSPEKPVAGSRKLFIGSEFEPKQSKSFVPQPQPLNGKVFAGIGFYTTPVLDGWFGQHDQMNSYMLNGYYQQSNGYVPNGDWWKGGFGTQGKYVMPDSSTFLPYMQISGTMQYDRDAYKAFASPSPNRLRDLSYFHTSLGLGSRYALPYRSLNGFDYTGVVGFSRYSAKDSIISAERDFFLSGTASTQFGEFVLRGQMDYRITSYDVAAPPPLSYQTGQWFVLRLDGRTMLLSNLQVNFSLRQYLYRGAVGAAAGRLYPQVDVQYFLLEGISAFVQFSPAVQRNTLAGTIQKNKYITFSSPMAHTDIPVEIATGMEAKLAERWTAAGKFRYRLMNNYQTFLDSNDAKLWEVLYLSGVRSTVFDVSIAYRSDDRTTIKAYLKTMREEQKDSSHSMPYVPALSFGTVAYHAFEMGLNVEVTAEYIGSRYTNFASTHKNAAYVYTGIKVDMLLFDRIRAYGELGNALSQKYYLWNGYQERTLYLMLGASYSW